MLGHTPLSTAPIGDDGGTELETVRAGYDSIPTGNLPDWVTNGIAAAVLAVGTVSVITEALITTTPTFGTLPITSANRTTYPDLFILDRKPNTLERFFSNQGDFLYWRPSGSPDIDFEHYITLGWRAKVDASISPNDGVIERPVWSEEPFDDDKKHLALSYQTKVRAELSDTPLVFQDAFAQLVNGEYTLPKETTPPGSNASKEVTLYQHDEVPVDNGDGTQTYTITSISDTPTLTLTTDIDDQTLYPNSGTERFANAFVGAIQSLNSFDPANTTGEGTVTEYIDSELDLTLAGFYGEADAVGQTPSNHSHVQTNASPFAEQVGGPEKFRNLFKDLPQKGFDIHNPVNPSRNGLRVQAINSGGTTKPTEEYYGTAWVKYGIQLQPAITAANFPDGSSVPQTHTLLLTLGLGSIALTVFEPLFDQASGLDETLTHLPTIAPQVADLPVRPSADPAIGSVFATADVSLDGVDLGTASLPDPQWFLNPARPQLVAEAKRPADDHVYPYLGRDLVVTDDPAVSFDQVSELGVLKGPKAVRKNFNEFPGYDASTTYQLDAGLGTINTSTVNNLELPDTVVATSALGAIQANVSFHPVNFLIQPQTITTSELIIDAEVNKILISRLITGTVATDSYVSGNANTAFSTPAALTLSENLNWSFVHSALTYPMDIADPLTPTVGQAGVQNNVDLSRTGVPDTAQLTLNPEIHTEVTMFWPSYVLYENHNLALEQLAIHFDFEAIKHLYSRKRGVSAGIPQNRIVNPTFATPRHLKLVKPKQHLDA